MREDKRNIEALVDMVSQMIQYNNPNMLKEEVKVSAFKTINNVVI